MKSFNLKKTYKEYELDLLGVEGLHKQTISSYRFWYEHIKKNAFKKKMILTFLFAGIVGLIIFFSII